MTRRRCVTFLFRVAAALLISHREALLATTDPGEAFKVMSTIGNHLHEPAAIDALLRDAEKLHARHALAPYRLDASRRLHAANLETKRGLHASQVACSAVVTASATAKEVAESAACLHTPSAATTTWTIVPASHDEGGPSGMGLDGWSIVERQLLVDLPVPRSSLSYYGLHYEPPNLLEAHFECAPSASDERQQQQDVDEGHALSDADPPPSPPPDPIVNPTVLGAASDLQLDLQRSTGPAGPRCV